MAKQFLPSGIPGVDRHVGSRSDGVASKNVESLGEESGDSESGSETKGHALLEAGTFESSGRDETRGNSQEKTDPANGFDLDDMIIEFKYSPPSSVNSQASYTENGCASKTLFEGRRLSVEASAALMPENIELGTQDTSTYSSQETSRTVGPAASNALRLILDGVQKLAQEQAKLTSAVNRMSSVLERLTGDAPPRKRETFEKSYNLELPFASREDFLKFDEQLATDEKCRTGLIHSLYQKYDVKKTLTKNLTGILRKFVSREVALVYTAQKCVAGKSVFKDTTFSSCLLETVDGLADDKLIAPVPDAEYFGNLGSVLSNAKDWGVARGERAAKRRRTLVP